MAVAESYSGCGACCVSWWLWVFMLLVMPRPVGIKRSVVAAAGQRAAKAKAPMQLVI